MKKVIIAQCALLLFASACFADSSTKVDFTKTGLTLFAGKASGNATTAGANQKTIAKTSTGVSVGAYSTTEGYAVVTQHKNGNKEYGTAHDSTAMYMIDAVLGTPTLDGPAKIGSTAILDAGKGTWTTM